MTCSVEGFGDGLYKGGKEGSELLVLHVVCCTDRAWIMEAMMLTKPRYYFYLYVWTDVCGETIHHMFVVNVFDVRVVVDWV
jgi:hypothetical protein